MFMADLTKRLEVPHVVDFVAASSYGKSTTSSANVKIKKDLNIFIEGKHVLLVDEMCDSGAVPLASACSAEINRSLFRHLNLCRTPP
jgi:hypoxanthine-guanine phosphoribosyltransferase